eukprot:2374386-Rhodomonas_salina.1
MCTTADSAHLCKRLVQGSFSRISNFRSAPRPLVGNVSSLIKENQPVLSASTRNPTAFAISAA